MKIALGSDLHLEFGDIDVTNTLEAEVLILSGDIMVANELQHYNPKAIEGFSSRKSIMYMNFLERCSSNYKDVIYIMGTMSITMVTLVSLLIFYVKQRKRLLIFIS